MILLPTGRQDSAQYSQILWHQSNVKFNGNRGLKRPEREVTHSPPFAPAVITLGALPLCSVAGHAFRPPLVEQRQPNSESFISVITSRRCVNSHDYAKHATEQDDYGRTVGTRRRRRFQFTVPPFIVQKYGYPNCSQVVRSRLWIPASSEQHFKNFISHEFRSGQKYKM